MSKTKFVYPFLIVLLCVTCGQQKTNLDSQFGSIRDAKATIMKEIRNLKFSREVFLEPMKPIHLKAYSPLPLITLFQVG